MTQLKDYLEKPETDWDKLYFELRTSNIGVDYPADVFVRTPVSQLNWIINECRISFCERANINSHTSARLATLLISVAQGFAGVKDTSNIPEPKHFLPFPDLDRYRSSNSPQRPSPETVDTLKQLLAQQRIPMHVFTMLMYPPTGLG